MRTILYSVTARDQLRDLLLQGLPKFGPRVVAEKRDRIYRAVGQFLARHPGAKRPHPDLGLVIYPVARTPFSVIYDFDDRELRVHFILHKHASLDELDPASVEW